MELLLFSSSGGREAESAAAEERLRLSDSDGAREVDVDETTPAREKPVNRGLAGSPLAAAVVVVVPSGTGEVRRWFAL